MDPNILPLYVDPIKMHMGGFPLGIQVHQRAAEIAELRRKMETKQHPQILQACILAQ